jgi:nanoRNase/pAp phosphatase (c-di-AMP/oligoRNAs hydrolase)
MTALSRLEKALGSRRALLIYSHRNPDPDTVGAALGLQFVLREAFGREAQLCYRGIIGRAENRELVKRLAPELKPARILSSATFDGAFLVDCQPDFGFDGDEDPVPLTGVIDHHPMSGAAEGVPFADIRPAYGSTSTILTEYIRECGREPSAAVATALWYGLKTDTQDLSRRAAPEDRQARDWLMPRVDHATLSAIENPKLSRSYYTSLVTALTRAVVTGDVILTEIGRVAYPDMVAEIADRLIRMERIRWSVCCGLHEKRLYLSVRTCHPERDAGDLVRTVLAGRGSGGGHDTMAAGRIELPDEGSVTWREAVSDLWKRFRVALECEHENPEALTLHPPSGPRI